MTPVSIELFAYPWDVIDAGEASFLDECAELGVNRVHAAVSYHSGKFLLPRNRKATVYFPQPGALYFHPEEAGWQGGLDQPISDLAETGWLDRLAREAASRNIELSAWTVFFHNSALGSRYPELIVQNAFGDGYPFALCPSHTAVQDHGAALCRALARLGIFGGIDLETIGYLGYSHGYHHEVTAVPMGSAERFLLSLCFCRACRTAGEKLGIEMQSLVETVQAILRSRMRSDDAGGLEESAERLATMLINYPALEQLIRLRMNTVTALVNRLGRESSGTKLAPFTSSFAGLPSNIWMEGISVVDLRQIADCFHLLAYGPSIADTNSDLVFFLTMTGDAARVNLTLNLGLPVTASFSDAAARVEYARSLGVRRFSFFNYGLLGENRLAWIKKLGCLARG